MINDFIWEMSIRTISMKVEQVDVPSSSGCAFTAHLNGIGFMSSFQRLVFPCANVTRLSLLSDRELMK